MSVIPDMASFFQAGQTNDRLVTLLLDNLPTSFLGQVNSSGPLSSALDQRSCAQPTGEAEIPLPLFYTRAHTPY